MPLHLAALSGSLRQASVNTALLRAAAELLPDDVTLSLVEHRDVPLYDGDVESAGAPEAVVRLRDALRQADALLIATPEYNHSVSGVLKNTLDWASRPAFKSSLAGLPTGILSAAPGAVGGARAQQHLKSILLAGLTPVFPGAEVIVNHTGDKFTDGALTDARTRDFLRSWLAGFVAWARVQPARPSAG